MLESTFGGFETQTFQTTTGLAPSNLLQAHGLIGSNVKHWRLACQAVAQRLSMDFCETRIDMVGQTEICFQTFSVPGPAEALLQNARVQIQDDLSAGHLAQGGNDV